MKEGAPVRFLILLVGGWTCLRVATLSAGWWSDGAGTEAALSPPSPVDRAAVAAPTIAVVEPAPSARKVRSVTDALPAPSRAWRQGIERPLRALATMGAVHVSAPIASGPSELAPAARPLGREAPVTYPSMPLSHTARPASAGTRLPARRWAGSAWLLARRDGGPALAPGGTLGGSQAGARLLYRLNDDASRPLALASRIYFPLHRPAGAEAAVGLDWRPSTRVPLHVLVERRQRLGREGRSAFAVTLYGGGSADLGPGWRLDGYAQAGLVGTRSRDAFFDGAARLSRAIGPIEAGGGLWAATQPGASRLDAGPHLALPIRIPDASLRLSAEYRFRVAGDARPSSGPALTLGVDF